jgi:citrate lyase alpha subunit
MTQEQKLALLKDKMTYFIQAAVKKDPLADTMFLSFFNALKDNDTFFDDLIADKEQRMNAEKAELEARLTAIDGEIQTLASRS